MRYPDNKGIQAWLLGHTRLCRRPELHGLPVKWRHDVRSMKLCWRNDERRRLQLVVNKTRTRRVSR